MVKYTGRDGKDYILRFDMSAMEALGETFEGGYSEAITKLKGGDMSLVQQMFAILANAGADFQNNIPAVHGIGRNQHDFQLVRHFVEGGTQMGQFCAGFSCQFGIAQEFLRVTDPLRDIQIGFIMLHQWFQFSHSFKRCLITRIIPYDLLVRDGFGKFLVFIAYGC